MTFHVKKISVKINLPLHFSRALKTDQACVTPCVTPRVTLCHWPLLRRWLESGVSYLSVQMCISLAFAPASEHLCMSQACVWSPPSQPRPPPSPCHRAPAPLSLRAPFALAYARSLRPGAAILLFFR